jgi:hypothetical protein
MRPALLLCVLALTLASCTAAPRDSAKDFKGDERAVAQAVEDLETAARKNDSDAACTKLFAQQLLTTLKDKTCKSAVKEAFKDADSTDLSVKDVTITGTKARATVTSGSGGKKRTDTLELEKAGTAWRIASL